MSKYLNICNGYILLWCLYSLQGILYSSGSIISQSILMIALCISLLYFTYANIKYYLSPFIKTLNVFIAVLTIYGIIMMLDGQEYFIRESYIYISKTDYLKTIYSSLLPIYAFYVFTKQGLLSQSTIRVWLLIFIIITTTEYWAGHYRQLQEAAENMIVREDFTNNIGYSFVALIPLLFFYNNKKLIQFTLLLYIMIYIIMSLKRGAILVGIIVFIWFLYRVFKTSSKRTKVWVSIMTIVAMIITCQQILDMYHNNDYFQYRLEQTLEGESSGRDVLYDALLTHFIYDTSIGEFLLGMGANGTLKVTDNFAHNDWLEIVTNQGLFGLVLFIIFWITLFKEWRNAKQLPIIYSALGAIFMICFLRTFFSMSYNDMPLCLTMCLGYCLANNILKNVNIKLRP